MSVTGDIKAFLTGAGPVTTDLFLAKYAEWGVARQNLVSTQNVYREGLGKLVILDLVWPVGPSTMPAYNATNNPLVVSADS